jgi:hypothetical protein
VPPGRWHVKYDDVRLKCGTPLIRGVPAVWNRSSKTIQCNQQAVMSVL